MVPTKKQKRDAEKRVDLRNARWNALTSGDVHGEVLFDVMQDDEEVDENDSDEVSDEADDGDDAEESEEDDEDDDDGGDEEEHNESEESEENDEEERQGMRANLHFHLKAQEEERWMQQIFKNRDRNIFNLVQTNRADHNW